MSDFDTIRKTIRGEQAGAWTVRTCLKWLRQYETALAASEKRAREAGKKLEELAKGRPRTSRERCGCGDSFCGDCAGGTR